VLLSWNVAFVKREKLPRYTMRGNEEKRMHPI